MVGLLVAGVVVLLGVFAWLMGAFRPFSSTVKFDLLYAFAGGVEVGSPVRVAGVKVGKVERIEFLPETGKDKEDPVALKVSITVSRAAWPSVREDSKFFVNMAGVIGERYIEVSPGTTTVAMLPDGSVVRGVDPPRIDQLLSQGYGVFGKIEDFLEENEATVTEFLKDLSGFLKRKDWKNLMALLDNANGVAGDLRAVTRRLRSPEAQVVLDKLYEMVNRAHAIDKETLKKFLQEEGIRARIF